MYIIEKGKQKLLLKRTALIGLTTAHDTVAYGGQAELSFIIVGTDSTALTIRRPTKYIDTVIQYYEGVYRTLPFEFQVGKFFKKDKKQFVQLLKLTEFETRRYPFKEIKTITCPIRTANEEGCVGCFFIPGVNVWYLISAKSAIRAKKRDMTIWKFSIE